MIKFINSINIHIFIFVSALLAFSCKKDKPVPKLRLNKKPLEVPKKNDSNKTILEQLADNYQQMPEKIIIISADKRVYTQYAKPTTEYRHGILGDQIEAKQLVVVVDSVFYELTLSSNYVFEDISPRLYDVDGNKQLEIITIRTHKSKGAGIAIYKVQNKQLVLYTNVPEIGISNRWLNIATISDLDNDNTVELAWIQTPHIGGILKVAKIQNGTVNALDQKRYYSNHAIGDRNLCLSVLTEQNNKKILYVPSQNRKKIAGFSFTNNRLKSEKTTKQQVDFSKKLSKQYNFSNIIKTGNNCD